jgi:hypothetical protein
VAGAPNSNNTAAPQAAGYILQLERALCHLGKAAADVSVAVEYLDDVALIREGQPILQEQDKNSVRPGAHILGDRSKALWRTLQIWLTHRQDARAASCKHYLIASNTPLRSPIATMIKGVKGGTIQPQEVVVALRAAGKSKSMSKVQKIIDEVLAHDDISLAELVARIEIVDEFDGREGRQEIANGLAIDPRVDSEVILDALLGWLTRTLQAAWQAQQPGVISRMACVRQCREIEGLQARQRFLPRPARDVPVGEVDRTRAQARPFVEHLSRIDADEEDLLQAVEHFIQFNIEKHRLAAEGEIADREWRDRSDRLRQRWRNITKSAQLEHRGCTPQEMGKRILIQSTYHHLEQLGGHPCSELYMTSGHYHRLADDDEVWWDPTYRSREGK